MIRVAYFSSTIPVLLNVHVPDMIQQFRHVYQNPTVYYLTTFLQFSSAKLGPNRHASINWNLAMLAVAQAPGLHTVHVTCYRDRH